MTFVKKLFSVILATTIAVGCTSSEKEAAEAGQAASTGSELAQKFIIVDGHVDLPYRLKSHWEDVSQRTDEGDFDYERAKKGGLDAPFMSIYIPARYQETGGAKAVADSLIDLVNGLAEDHPEKFAIATSPQDIKEQFKKELISLPMGMENGAPIGTELSNVKYFYDRGIRYITLAHSRDNEISDSSYDMSEDRHDGLSDFGHKVVQEMNNQGIMVDVSHITDEAFYDVMETTEAPVVATHSSCRHFTPGFERNMSDSLISRLAENGGVIMINFGSTFLDSASSNSSEKVRAEIEQKIQEKGLEPGSKEAEAFSSTYFEENLQYSSVQKVADHIDHVVDLVGIDHVGLGSDYDGVGNTLPVGLKDASQYPNLLDELLDRGYSEEDIQKICSGNIFRVWEEVNQVAQSMD
ncbi:dipeptidase [Fodinibius salsisoli]|uniref:Dipeptidase n=1 Tax=Fodinibius salsisoli TaxID=2820877 RepID=A0ABT3PR28_9BACT|nr:dipeptidase [Fodinibius salsisoli]MCW9708305.1 dipeptidase [Fodinibius salsisoli]